MSWEQSSKIDILTKEENCIDGKYRKADHKSKKQRTLLCTHPGKEGRQNSDVN